MLELRAPVGDHYYQIHCELSCSPHDIKVRYTRPDINDVLNVSVQGAASLSTSSLDLASVSQRGWESNGKRNVHVLRWHPGNVHDVKSVASLSFASVPDNRNAAVEFPLEFERAHYLFVFQQRRPELCD